MTEPIWDLIDRDVTLTRLANDQALFDELVGFFLEDYRPLMESLAAAVSSSDAPAVERTAHSLKGLAANLGATAAATAAGTLEALGRQRDLSDAADAERAFVSEMRRLVATLSAYRAASNH